MRMKCPTRVRATLLQMLEYTIWLVQAAAAASWPADGYLHGLGLLYTRAPRPDRHLLDVSQKLAPYSQNSSSSSSNSKRQTGASRRAWLLHTGRTLHIQYGHHHHPTGLPRPPTHTHACPLPPFSSIPYVLSFLTHTPYTALQASHHNNGIKLQLRSVHNTLSELMTV